MEKTQVTQARETKYVQNNPEIGVELTSSRVRYIGHILRKEDNSSARQVLQNVPSGD